MDYPICITKNNFHHKRPCCCLVPKSCLTLLRPYGLQPSRLLCPRVLQARILEWVAISFSRVSSQTAAVIWLLDGRYSFLPEFPQGSPAHCWQWLQLLTTVTSLLHLQVDSLSLTYQRSPRDYILAQFWIGLTCGQGGATLKHRCSLNSWLPSGDPEAQGLWMRAPLWHKQMIRHQIRHVWGCCAWPPSAFQQSQHVQVVGKEPLG